MNIDRNTHLKGWIVTKVCRGSLTMLNIEHIVSISKKDNNNSWIHLSNGTALLVNDYIDEIAEKIMETE